MGDQGIRRNPGGGRIGVVEPFGLIYGQIIQEGIFHEYRKSELIPSENSFEAAL